MGPPTQNVTKRHQQLTKRADGWWMGNKEHRGAYPFGDRDYQVFRDVTDIKWATNGTARCAPDGKTDCTKAIENAMKAGKRCGAKCSGSTTKQAILYFPSGTYLISHTIEIYFGTQMIGDALDPPLIVASSSFIGLGVFSTNHYVENEVAGANGSGKEHYVNTSSFYRQIRNFQIDLRKAPTTAGGFPMCGIHYQVGQATSLANIVFMMSQPTHYGVYAENGNGGYISDLIFEGGGYGIYGGSQQFTAQRITFSDVVESVVLLSDGGWSWKTINIIGGDTGFKLVSSAADGKHNAGSIIILDSTFSGTKTAVQTLPASDKPKAGIIGITLENVLFKSVGQGVVDTAGKKYFPGGSQNITNWILGPTYFSQSTGYRNYTFGFSDQHIKRLHNMTSPINNRNLPLRPFFERPKPQYTDIPWSKFLSVKSVGAKGDGVTDDTKALQAAINSAVKPGDQLVLYFDAGTYILKDTLFVPPGSRIVGEAWAQLAAEGSRFSDAGKPTPMLQIGEVGDIGAVEIQDLLFTVKGPTAGAVLVEWNIMSEDQGKAGMWDCHVRIGGAVGTALTSKECPASHDAAANTKCIAGSMMMHITELASAYLEVCTQ
ncbi:hypothetical protein AA313_de0206670 [Arthrobotrys entomopaga]|nr:hypothetical protein AA313_de0206670 [Arthrobotrys entomopaga]